MKDVGAGAKLRRARDTLCFTVPCLLAHGWKMIVSPNIFFGLTDISWVMASGSANTSPQSRTRCF